MTNCTIIGNTASGGSLYGNGQGYVTSSFYGGGAIYSTTGSVITIANSTFTGNTTNGDGGGIYTSGTATVTNSAFTANEAACAGGIFNNGVLTVNNSTFANSTGAFYGGGIWNDSEDAGAGGLYQYATLTVTNSTFSHNAVNGWCSAGGGICGGGNGTITVSNSTFANNSTNGLYNNGGGIYGNMTINNTISPNSERVTLSVRQFTRLTHCSVRFRTMVDQPRLWPCFPAVQLSTPAAMPSFLLE